MLVNERHAQILDYLFAHRYATIDELCARVYASPATIRRDLADMEATGAITRVWGGATLPGGSNIGLPQEVRLRMNETEKRRIAVAAARLIRDNTSIFLDSSSTCIHLARLLGAFRGLTVVANGFETLAALNRLPSSVKIVCTGGALDGHYEYIGVAAQNALNTCRADQFFFSCGAVSAGDGITFSGEENARIKQLMRANAREAVLLCDHSKFDASLFCRAFGFEDVNLIVTDARPENDILYERIKDKLIVAP